MTIIEKDKLISEERSIARGYEQLFCEMRGIRVRMRGIRVAMQGIEVGMWEMQRMWEMRWEHGESGREWGE